MFLQKEPKVHLSQFQIKQTFIGVFFLKKRDLLNPQTICAKSRGLSGCRFSSTVEHEIPTLSLGYGHCPFDLFFLGLIHMEENKDLLFISECSSLQKKMGEKIWQGAELPARVLTKTKQGFWQKTQRFFGHSPILALSGTQD